MAHLDVAIFSTLPWKSSPNLSDWEGISCSQPSTAHPTKFQFWLRSGLRLGHSKTSFSFEWSHSLVDLDTYFGTLLCWKGGRWKGEIPPHLQCSCRHLKVLWQDWLIFGTVHNSLHLDQSPSSSWWKTGLKHDTATTMLHQRESFLLLMCSVVFVANISFGIMAKSSVLVLSDCNTFYHMLLGNFFFFFPQTFTRLGRVICRDI